MSDSDMGNKTKPNVTEDISMSFEDNTPKENTATAANVQPGAEVLKYNDKIVAERDEKNQITVFDTEGNQIDPNTLQNLYDKNKPAPETDNQDFPKKGDVKRRFTKEFIEDEKQQDGRVIKVRKTKDVPEAECEMVSEKQEYESGQVFDRTVEAKYWPAVKFLRGEIDFAKKEG